MSRFTGSVADAKTELVALLTTALATSGASGEGVPVFYAWNPQVSSDCAFLGRPLFFDDIQSRVAVTTSSPVAEATRLGNATYTVEGTCWSWRPELTPDLAATAETRVAAFWTAARSALAPTSWVGTMTAEHQLRPFENGWAAMVLFTVEVHALLT